MQARQPAQRGGVRWRTFYKPSTDLEGRAFMLKSIIAATAALLVAGPLFAGTPGLDHREHHQAQRIRQGVNSGELTRPEARRLVRGEARLHRNEARAKSD